MKSTLWKLCVLLIAFTMFLTIGAFAEGTIGIVALLLYGLSTCCGICWAFDRAFACEESNAEYRRADKAAPARRASMPASSPRQKLAVSTAPKTMQRTIDHSRAA